MINLNEKSQLMEPVHIAGQVREVKCDAWKKRIDMAAVRSAPSKRRNLSGVVRKGEINIYNRVTQAKLYAKEPLLVGLFIILFTKSRIHREILFSICIPLIILVLKSPPI